MNTRLSQQLSDRRGPLVEQMQELANLAESEDRAFTADEQSKFDQLDSEAQVLTQRINTAVRCESTAAPENGTLTLTADPVVDYRANQTAPTSISYADPDPSTEKRHDLVRKAFRGWLMGRYATRGDQQICHELGVDIRNDRLELQLLENPNEELEERQQLTDPGTAGGFLVPEEFQRELTMALKNTSGVRNVCRTINTASGADLQWPSTNDTADSQIAPVTAEGAARTLVDAVFQQVTFTSFTYTTLMQVSRELMQDAFMSMDSIMGQLAGGRLARGLNRDLTLGNGTAAPLGIINAGASGVTLGAANAPTYDNVVDAIHSVDPDYRALPSFGIMANDKTIAGLRKLKDSQGFPIWQLPVSADMPSTILGVPIYLNNRLSDQALGVPMVVGAFEHYVARDVAQQGALLQRLDERYAELGLIGYVMHSRHDGRFTYDESADDHGAIKTVANP